MSELKKQTEVIAKLEKQLQKTLIAAEVAADIDDYDTLHKIMNKYAIRSYKMRCELRDIERSKKAGGDA